MRTKSLTPGRALAWVIMAAIVVGTVFPFWWMIRTALTPAADIYTDNAGLLPGDPTLVNFARVLGLTSEAEARAAGGSGAHIDFARYILNSTIYCGLIASLQTLFCAMAG